jgi:hypothetical protein
MKMLPSVRQRIAQACLWIALTSAGAVHAQNTNLPGVRILQGSLVSPSSAATYYGTATTHSVSVTGYSRSPEVTALANGLGAALVAAGKLSPAVYAQRVNEYVYNNIRLDFMFGEQKGALGALIDQSGTPFDQANLLGELLKAAGIAVTYNIGTVSLTAAQFTGWTGIGNPVAACRLLADGGIPGTVNGSSTSTCDPAILGTTLSGATLLHIWVSALGNRYDPSFKSRTFTTGIDLANAMGCGTAASPTCGTSTVGAASTAANTANLGTLPAIGTVNQTSIESNLRSWAMNLKSRLDSTYPNAATTDIVGGSVINPAGLTTPGQVCPMESPLPWSAPATSRINFGRYLRFSSTPSISHCLPTRLRGKDCCWSARQVAYRTPSRPE